MNANKKVEYTFINYCYDRIVDLMSEDESEDHLDRIKYYQKVNSEYKNMISEYERYIKKLESMEERAKHES